MGVSSDETSIKLFINRSLSARDRGSHAGHLYYDHSQCVFVVFLNSSTSQETLTGGTGGPTMLACMSIP